MLSDPIADMLTRIRNASRVSKETVNIKASKIGAGIADVLKEQGFISDYVKIDDATGQGLLRITLKYMPDGTAAITTIKRESKPGRRLYSSAKEIPMVLGGMGIAVISTSKGVMTDKRCHEENIGGEIICTVS